MRKYFTYAINKLYSTFLLAVIIIFGVSPVNAQISVTATAGTLGPTAYTTLGAAFTAINAGTHQGAINISVTGSTTEPTTAVLNYSGSGAANYGSVIIKPATGVTATINSNLVGGPIDLNGVTNVTIDGSNTVGGTTQNLTITNTDGTGADDYIIWLQNVGANCAGVRIENCILTGGGATVTDGFAIVSCGNIAGGYQQSAGSTTDITIQNNNISGVEQVGIYAYGATTYDFNWNVTGNTITATGFGGIQLNYSQGANITYNDINNCGLMGGGAIIGIDLSFNSIGDNIYGNQINTITNAAAFGAYGIWINAGGTSTVNVYNNFIANIKSGSNGTVSRNGHGIYMDFSGSLINIYYNSINQSVNQVATAIAAFTTSAICFNGTAASTPAASVGLVDNILVNTQTIGTRYSIYCNNNIANTVFRAYALK